MHSIKPRPKINFNAILTTCSHTTVPLFQNEMKPFYWLILGKRHFEPIGWLYFVLEQYITVTCRHGLNLPDHLFSDAPVSFATFLPGLPPPPKSKPDPTGRPAPIFDVTSSDSSGDESNDDDFDDGFHRDGVGNDFFKL